MIQRDPLRVPGWPVWMGSPKYVALVGFLVILISSVVLEASKPLNPTFWRVLDIVALVLGGAGILVVVLDARRTVAVWQLEQISNWVPRYLAEWKKEVCFLVEYTVPERAGPATIGSEEIYTKAHEIWDRERPHVHGWATELSDRLEQIAPDDLTIIKLDGNLAGPEINSPDIRQIIDSIVFWASHYSDARDLTASLREIARIDDELSRATTALAPFALITGLALALSAMLTKPLAV